MSEKHILKLFLVLALIFDSLHNINGLSAIQVPNSNEGDANKSPEASENSLRNAIESLNGKVIQNDPEIQLPVEQMQYDSLDDIQYIDENVSQQSIVRGKKNIKQWDHWGKWSDCSVSCGVGKTVRWRHCVSDGCADGEKEAQIRTCTMSPCG
uniref:ADAMTS cysteine-rich domain-containing protein n=1 Tax=Dendroctonus ponderosae TaxID=77166 RepID=A0AAR5QCY2_DENPD